MCKNIEDPLPGFMIRNKYKRPLVKSFKRNLGCKALLFKIINLPLSKSVLPVKSHGFACLFEWFVFDLSRFLLSNFLLGAIFLSQSLLGDYDVSALSTFNMALHREG